MWKTKGKTRVISLLLVIVFMFASTNVYAQTFKDVSPTGSYKWAYDFIEQMSKEKIIAGYDTGEFKPAAPVTKSQAVAMIVRAMKIDSTKTKEARQKYNTILTQAGVQDWFKDNLAVALTAGIITENELKTFYTNGKEVEAQRLEVTRYMTRAMGLEEEAKKNTFFVLDFIDIEGVGAEDRQFIKILVDKGILNPKGDGEYRFNPYKTITRAEVSVMLYKYYTYLKENLLFNVLPNTKQESTETQKKGTIDVAGQITNVAQVGDYFYITVKIKSGATATYRLDSKSVVRLDGTKVTYNSIAIGQNIEAEIEEKNLYVVSLEAKSIIEEITGIVKSVSTTKPYSITVDYKPNSKSTTTERRTFAVESDTDISLNGKDAYLKDIKEGDTVTIFSRNGIAEEIEAESKYKVVEGVIKEVKISSNNSKLVVIDEDDDEYEFSVNSKAAIYRNDRKAELKDLKKGDEVVLELEYNVVIDIDATVVKSTDKGIIETMVLSRTSSQITIKRSDDKLVTYAVAPDAEIRISRNTGKIDELKVGYYVELDIEGDEIVYLSAIARESSNTKTGIVEYISSRSGLIEITEVDFVTGEKTTSYVYVTDKTTYIDINGRITSFGAIEVDDEIFISGEYIGKDFTAKTITIIGTSN